jgi:hypothetical protein
LWRRADTGNDVDFIETHSRAVFTGVSPRQFHWVTRDRDGFRPGGEDVQTPEDVRAR